MKIEMKEKGFGWILITCKIFLLFVRKKLFFCSYVERRAFS